MKEATGELSTTVIAIVAIAAILTIFTLILLPRLKNSISAKSMCASATCLRTNCPADQATCECEYIEMTTDAAGAVSTSNTTVTCPNPYIDNSN